MKLFEFVNRMTFKHYRHFALDAYLLLYDKETFSFTVTKSFIQFLYFMFLKEES